MSDHGSGQDFRAPDSPRRGARTPPPATRREEEREARKASWKCSEWLSALAEEIGFSLFFRLYIGYQLLASWVFAAAWGYHTMMGSSARMMRPPKGSAFWFSASYLCLTVLILTFASAVLDMITRMFIHWLGLARDSANLFWIPNTVSSDDSRMDTERAERKLRRRRNYMLGVFEIVTLFIPLIYAIAETISRKESALALVGTFSFVSFVVFQVLLAMQYVALWWYSIRSKMRAKRMGREMKKAWQAQMDQIDRQDDAGSNAAGSNAGSQAKGGDREYIVGEKLPLWMRRPRKNPLVMSEGGLDIFSVRGQTVIIAVGLIWAVIMSIPVGLSSGNMIWLMIALVTSFLAFFMGMMVSKPSKDHETTAKNQDKTSIISFTCMIIFCLLGPLSAFVGDSSGASLAGLCFVLLVLTQGNLLRRHTMHVQTPYQPRTMRLSLPGHREQDARERGYHLTHCLPMVPCPRVWRSCCSCSCLDAEGEEDYVYSLFQMEHSHGTARVSSSESRVVQHPPRVPGHDNSFRRLKATQRDGVYNRVGWLSVRDSFAGESSLELERGKGPADMPRDNQVWHGLVDGALLTQVNGESVFSREDADRAVSEAPDDFELVFKHPLKAKSASGKERWAREYHLDWTDRVLTANIKISAWYFFIFAVLVAVSFAYRDIQEGLTTTIADNSSLNEPHQGFGAYAVCDMRWSDALDFNVVDFALLSALSYHDRVNDFDEDLEVWFGGRLVRSWPPLPKSYDEKSPEWDKKFASGAKVPVEFWDVEAQLWDTHIIVIRGDSSGAAWLRDVDIWSDAALYQILASLNPFWALWDHGKQVEFVSFLGFPKKMMIVEDFHVDIETHIRSLTDKKVVLTGHGTAGGHARLLAQKLGLPVVSFASPGTRWSSKRLDIPSELAVDDVTIIPQRSLLSMVDRHAGFTQETHCHSGLSGSDCTRMESILCDLLRACGDSQKRQIAGIDPSNLAQVCPKPVK
eukprot:Hpha_TRINITY_DN12565_c0_g1::TRINITY_DN12565_c0_g1_i1::g.51153::m.51153